MKRILFLILITSCSFDSSAQKEISKGYRTIPAQEHPPTEIPLQKDDDAVPDLPGNEKTLIINADELFNDTTKYKKESNTPGVFHNRNQYLGGFRTTTKISTVRYRDAASIDGDKIKVYLNDKVIENEVTLDGDFQGFNITLVKGINKIDFEALNEGFASPNTAEFEIYDDNGKIIKASQWNVGTGYKATIIIYKE
jgi:hypothetical protein